jgi:hypothetical protein
MTPRGTAPATPDLKGIGAHVSKRRGAVPARPLAGFEDA